MTKLGMAVNLHRCIGCRTCVISCKMENSLPLGVQRMRVLNPDGEAVAYDRPTGTYPNVEMSWTPTPCMHCDEPPCVDVCPSGASIKRPNGIVYVDAELCIQCSSCVVACPYGARQLDEENNKIEKCTFCAHRLENGVETTMCQLCCPGDAITVGDLEDSESEISKLLATYEASVLQEEAGTGPNVYYYRSHQISSL